MMGALIRALTNNAVENIEEALGMTDATSSAMKHAIAEWYAAWYGRVPTKTEDPCQRLPYAIVNKLCKATFGEYDSGLQHTDSAKGKYLDCVRSAFDACKTSFMTQAMIGGEAWAKPVPMPDGRLTWQIVGRDSIIILGRDASGIPSDVALCEKSVSADHHFYTLVERRTSFAGRLTIQYRLYCSDNKSTLGRRVPLASLPQYERLEDEYTFAVPIDGVGMVFLRILSPEDIQQLIKRPQMQGIGAVGNAGALFTCEKVFGYSQKNAEGWFKALKKKYPLYKGESGKIEDALAQRIAFAEELRRDGAKYGLIFSR